MLNAYIPAVVSESMLWTMKRGLVGGQGSVLSATRLTSVDVVWWCALTQKAITWNTWNGLMSNILFLCSVIIANTAQRLPVI